jgi:hypothetical protein
MQKIILLILSILIINISIAQTDTSKYLLDTIRANKALFIGNPLSVLFDSLKIDVKIGIFKVLKKNGKDSVYIKELVLYFKDTKPSDLADYQNLNMGPAIKIVFTTPFSVSNHYFDNKSLLGSWYFNAYKRQFYGHYIVGDIK